MYNKTVIITQTVKLITFYKITETLLHNIIVYLINFTKEMQHVVFLCYILVSYLLLIISTEKLDKKVKQIWQNLHVMHSQDYSILILILIV